MLFSSVLIFTVTLAVFCLLFWILARRARFHICDPLDWLEDFSAVSYRPMERLLDNRDYEFLASQPGFVPSIARRLRRQRVAIFQTYLRGIFLDFHRLMGVAKIIVVYAGQDQSPFQQGLWRLRWKFYASIVLVEARVVLNALGLGSVDARALLTSLERLQVSTQNLIPAVEPIG